MIGKLTREVTAAQLRLALLSLEDEPDPRPRVRVPVRRSVPAPLHSHRSVASVKPLGSYAQMFTGRVIPPVGV